MEDRSFDSHAGLLQRARSGFRPTGRAHGAPWPQETGSLLIITLWLVTILSAFAVAIARYLSVEVRVTKYRLMRAQAQTMAHSGVYVAMRRLAFDGTHGDEAYDWLGDPDWAFVQGDGLDPADQWELRAAGTVVDPMTAGLLRGSRARVQIIDEERKVNLNAVLRDQSVVAALGRLLGGSSDGLVARIVDYVDADAVPYVVPTSGAAGLEIDRSTDPPYVAKNAPVAVHEELLAIPGMEQLPPKSFAEFREMTSAQYGVAATLNINTASPGVLRAIGLSDATVTAIEQFRTGPDGSAAHEQDGKFERPGVGIVETLQRNGWSVADPQQQIAEQTLLTAMGVSSQTFTVVSTGEVPLSPGRADSPVVSARVEAVVRRTGCGEGRPEPCITAWREW